MSVVINSYLTRHIFNPIALRKAKIVYNFGLSERKRVKLKESIPMISSRLQYKGNYS